MSRYIDADKLIAEMECCSYETWSKGVNHTWWAQAVKVKDNIKECIKRQPTADVEEVVRCCDCKYRNTPECKMWYQCVICGDYHHWERDEYYCSYGERREE